MIRSPSSTKVYFLLPPPLSLPHLSLNSSEFRSHGFIFEPHANLNMAKIEQEVTEFHLASSSGIILVACHPLLTPGGNPAHGGHLCVPAPLPLRQPLPQHHNPRDFH